MGLDIYLDWDGKTEADQETQYKANEPADYAKAGYLRSSYNDGGFNSWARRHLNKKDLYWIFDCPGEEGPGWREETNRHGEEVHRFYPDWQASRARALEVVDLVEKVPPFALIRGPTPMKVYKPEEVIAAFMEHKNKWDGKGGSSFEWYSSQEGLFFQDDRPTVLAVMWQRSWHEVEPVLVVESDHAYYREFARAVVDFIDAALTKPNPRMSWSG